ncbi:MAG TPA: ATP-binding protein [Spirochaetota bacterium]|nr:ATP-binding protein [Spirochaetota bacterium]
MKTEYRIKTLRKIVGKAINRYGMIAEGDRVLIALSGGIDSLVLLDAVAGRRRGLPISYHIAAAHIHMEGLGVRADVGFLEAFCRERNVELMVRTVQGQVDFSVGDSRCFFCSWHRRKALFAVMKEVGFSRLAFGHHLDDVIETLLLNMTFHAKFSTMPLRLPMFGGEFDIIRPLGLLMKRQVSEYALAAGLSPIGGECPWSDQSKRSGARRIIGELEGLNPGARVNMFRSMENINREYLPSGYDDME